MGTIKGCINTKKTLNGFQLMVRVQYSRTKKKEYRLGEFLPKRSYFDVHSGLVKKRKDVDYTALNKLITDKVSELQKQNIDFTMNPNIKMDLLAELERNIMKSEAEGKFNSKRIFYYTHKHICNYLKSINKKQELLITEIDDVFLDELKIFLLNDGLASSTIKIYFDKMKSVFNKINKRLRQNLYNPLSDYKIKIINKKLVLPADTIIFFEKYIPIVPERIYYQQWSLFQFYSQGTRISDIIRMKWSDIVISDIGMSQISPYIKHRLKTFSISADDAYNRLKEDEKNKPRFYIKFNALKTGFEHKILLSDKAITILRFFLDNDLQLKSLIDEESIDDKCSGDIFDKPLMTYLGIQSKCGKAYVIPPLKRMADIIYKLVREQVKRTPNKCIFHNVDTNGLSDMELRTFVHNKTTTINKSLSDNEKDGKYPIKEHLSTHSFRHLFAINYYTATRDIYSLSKLLFHNNIATTERYLKKLDIQLIADDDISKFYSKF